MHQGHEHGAMGHDLARKHYLMLGLNLVASGVVMYFVMYTMIDTAADLYNNLNNLYMTLMMVTSMAILMLWMMRGMYPNRRLNIILYAGFALLFLFSLWGNAGADRRRSVPPLDDPAPFGRDPDVRAIVAPRSRDQAAVRGHHRLPDGRDRPDEGDAGASIGGGDPLRRRHSTVTRPD
jgi:hypothetical protein